MAGAATMSFSIVTPERLVERMEVERVTLMTASGEVTILPGHVPLVSLLTSGVMTIVRGGVQEYLANSTGFVEVRANGEVVILADSADRADELDAAAIERAAQEAREVMSRKDSIDDAQFARAAAALERELAREKVLRKRRH